MEERTSVKFLTGLIVALSWTQAPSSANATDIKVLSGGALRSTFDVLIPEFEKSSGHKVTLVSGAAGEMMARIQKNEAVDVAVITQAQIAKLVKEGKIVLGTPVGIASVGIGMAGRKGEPKSDIGSLEAFKRRLLAAKSIGQSDPASGTSSAIYTAMLLADLDIAADLKSKIKICPSNSRLFEAFAKGEVELGLGQLTEIAEHQHIVLFGPLPNPVQNITRFSAGIAAHAKEPEAAKVFVDFLRSPGATSIMKAKGIDPG